MDPEAVAKTGGIGIIVLSTVIFNSALRVGFFKFILPLPSFLPTVTNKFLRP